MCLFLDTIFIVVVEWLEFCRLDFIFMFLPCGVVATLKLGEGYMGYSMIESGGPQF